MALENIYSYNPSWGLTNKRPAEEYPEEKFPYSSEGINTTGAPYSQPANFPSAASGSIFSKGNPFVQKLPEGEEGISTIWGDTYGYSLEAPNVKNEFLAQKLDFSA